MGYSIIFYPYRGMDEQILKTQYVLERMIVSLINPLELNLCPFDPLEKIIDTWKNFSVSHPEKGTCENLLPGKIYLR